MSKFFTMTSIILIFFTVTACKTTTVKPPAAPPSAPPVVDVEPDVKEGWIGNDKYRIIASATPQDGIEKKDERRKSSKTAALLLAQKRIVQTFVQTRIMGLSDASDAASTGIAIQKQFSEVIKGGTIVNFSFSDDDSCDIIYEIEEKNLKLKVSDAKFKD